MSRSPRSSVRPRRTSCWRVCWRRCAPPASPEVRSDGCTPARDTRLSSVQGAAQVPARRAGAGMPHGSSRLSDPRRGARDAGGRGTPARRRRSSARALREGRRVFRVVIPARHASARLAGKVLRPIGGKPMLQWVYERACAAGAREVLIATDDERIISAARAFGAEAVPTARSHASGTDRIAEVARARRWPQEDIVVNVQGDEPLIPPALIGQVAALLDPNAVKVVTDASGRALYFSRAPIPWNRDSAPSGPASQRDCGGARRHVGIYGYRVGSLLRLAQLPRGVLEAREKLEQLRALEHGLAVYVAEALEAPGPDVNTLADLERVTALMTAPVR